MLAFQIPGYRGIPPGPLYWRNETSGVLRSAVEAYLANRCEETPIRPEDVEIVRAYCEYWILAPCWETLGYEEEFRSLRERIKTASTSDLLSAWIYAALDVGIDPL